MTTQIVIAGVLSAGAYAAYVYWPQRKPWFHESIPIPTQSNPHGGLIMGNTGLVIAAKDIPNFSFVPVDNPKLWQFTPWHPTP